MLDKIIFEREKIGDILSSKDLVDLFRTSFSEQLNSSDIEVFVKVGSLLEPLKFECRVERDYGAHNNNRIFELDEPRLIAGILCIAKKRRVIDDDIYEDLPKSLYNFDLNGGVYIVVSGGVPVIRIIDTPQEKCTFIYRPASFELINYRESGFFNYGCGVLKHTPDLESVRQVELELSINEGVDGRSLVNFYKGMVKHYEEKGFTTVDS